jgi:hypothetical protein
LHIRIIVSNGNRCPYVASRYVLKDEKEQDIGKSVSISYAFAIARMVLGRAKRDPGTKTKDDEDGDDDEDEEDVEEVVDLEEEEDEEVAAAHEQAVSPLERAFPPTRQLTPEQQQLVEYGKSLTLEQARAKYLPVEIKSLVNDTTGWRKQVSIQLDNVLRSWRV